jgi:hypothetical protein
MTAHELNEILRIVNSSVDKKIEDAARVVDVTREEYSGVSGDLESYRSPSVTDSPGIGLPSGGEQYQVLQRDGRGVAIWDWVRAAPDLPEEEE